MVTFTQDMLIECALIDRCSNHIISAFSMCDSFTLSRLHTTFCESFYDIELFLYFTHRDWLQLYVSWKIPIRRIFKVPPKTHTYIISRGGLLNMSLVCCIVIILLLLNLCPRFENYRYIYVSSTSWAI